MFLASCNSTGTTTIVVADPQISIQPTSTEILNQSSEIYQQLKTYQDKGVVTKKVSSGKYKNKASIWFTTVFSHDGKFRYEFWKPGARYTSNAIIWKKNSEIKTWQADISVVDAPKNMRFAINGFIDNSGGSSKIIPQALMSNTDLDGLNLSGLKMPGSYRIMDAIENKHPCYRVQQLLHTQDGIDKKVKTTYWIRKDNFMLIRVDEIVVFDDFYSETFASYKVEYNQPIPDAAFIFGH